MTIPLTIIGPERSSDLVLPADVPVAVLIPEIATLTGSTSTRLTWLTGRELEPSLSLADNGVSGGALLLDRADDAYDFDVDDIADVLSEQSDDRLVHEVDATAIMLALVAALLGGLAIYLRSGTVALMSLAAVIGWTLLPRLVLRGYGLAATTDPTEPGVGDRVRSAHRATMRIGRGLATCVLAGGIALVCTGTPVGVLAGWLLMLSVTFRVACRDRPGSIAVLTAAAIALVSCIQVGDVVQLLAGIVGGLIVAGVLGHAGRTPFVRVLQQYAEHVVTFIVPIMLLAASGLPPALPT